MKFSTNKAAQIFPNGAAGILSAYKARLAEKSTYMTQKTPTEFRIVL